MSARMVRVTRRDYTGHFGPLFKSEDKPRWPMYSYDRPAYLFWNGVANSLRARGFSDEQIGEILASKDMRHGLDQFEGKVEEAGAAFAATFPDFSWVGRPKGASPDPDQEGGA